MRKLLLGLITLAALALALAPFSAGAQTVRKTRIRNIVQDSACAPAAGWDTRDTLFTSASAASLAAQVKRTCPAPIAPPPPDVTTPPVVTSPPGPTPPPVPVGVTVLFRDSFESGDFSAVQHGVRWTSNAYVDVSTTIALSGTRSARFRQGKPLGDGSWAELRFGGLPRVNEVFVQFALYMPNGAESPSVGPRVSVKAPGGNDKFFRLWADDYGAAPKFGASTWPRSGGIGAIGSEYTFVPDAGDGAPWSMGQGMNPSPTVPFIAAANLGRWVHIRIRVKVSGPDNRSGVIQLWADGTLLINDTSLPVYPPGGIGNFLANGYLLGYANSGFQAGQMMYIDDVVISIGGFAP